MSDIFKNSNLLHFPRVEYSASITIDANSTPEERRIMVSNPSNFQLNVKEGVAQLIVIKDDELFRSTAELFVGADARLDVVEISNYGGESHILFVGDERSRCNITAVAMGNSAAAHTVHLVGANAECEYSSVFIAGEGEKASIILNVEHHAPDCRSNSVIKGVATGNGEGSFSGMVYVTPDAQRTDARQTSRNITIGDRARIKARPQLEILADDVKCSHGATIGQMDSDAVMYMRQRGLSEQMARRMQIEGFVADVVSHCEVGYMQDFLLGMLSGKMDKIL